MRTGAEINLAVAKTLFKRAQVRLRWERLYGSSTAIRCAEELFCRELDILWECQKRTQVRRVSYLRW